LFDHVCQKAKQLKLKKLFLSSTQTAHWFIERGFQPSTMDSLPESLKALYNPERNSKVLCKIIE
jgi:amino-acid N-acetyltransferase